MIIILVLYYRNENTTKCDDNVLPKSRFGVSCNKICEKGYFLNMLKTNPECEMCPDNTYSLGGSLRIDGNLQEWTQQKLSLFENLCTYEETETWKKSLNCEGFKINSDKTFIEAGNSNLKMDSVYYFELSYGVYFKKPGNVFYF